MKKRFSIVLVCFCFLVSLTSCTSAKEESPVGIWEDEAQEIVIQFASDSSFTMGISGYRSEGTYQISGSEIQITLVKNELGLEQPFAWQYRRDGSNLILTKGDTSMALHPFTESGTTDSPTVTS